MRYIDGFLNRITTYRLVVYSLGLLAAVGVVFSFSGRISATPTELVISLALVLVSAYATDRLFGKLYHVPTNMESALITSLILFLIMQPANSFAAGLALVLGGAISSASKFVIVWNGKHIFNPAAFGAAVLSLTGLAATTWWVGNSALWPYTLLLGLAIVRKIRRFPLVLTFAFVSIALQFWLYLVGHQSLANDMKQALIASPLIFMGTIMLTEPATMPPRRRLQMVFGALVGVLYITSWEIGPLIIYPEVALLLGNVFAFAVSPKFRVRLQLKEIQKISDRVYDYVFQPDRSFGFLPGQYMEWTLPGVPYDSRGNRRTFTIASSPTETEVHIGVKFYEPASMYKAALEKLQPGDMVDASQLAGNFILKGNEQKKLVFIAGGIGITPFRSMIKYVTDKNMSVDIVLLYAVSDPGEFAYASELKAARQVGVKIFPIVTNPDAHAPGTVSAQVNEGLIPQLVPDYAERTFYVSGPSAMVDATKHSLRNLGIQQRHIKTDHFSGY